ncbi:MAG: ribose 5-phosphate isomerase B [Clostridia bacterium]|nr:ribose 5-phosphate isomerase B [Clostridia bacterium]
MMIAIACDHAAVELKKEVEELLTSLGLAYKDFGTYDTASCDYAVFAARAARAVASGACERGILICGTGIGMSIAANKIKGIRCSLCGDPLSAKLTRAHNNSNMLAMGARIIGPELAKEIVRVWLDTPFDGGRHQHRIDLIAALERGEEIE